MPSEKKLVLVVDDAVFEGMLLDAFTYKLLITVAVVDRCNSAQGARHVVQDLLDHILDLLDSRYPLAVEYIIKLDYDFVSELFLKVRFNF